jgi:hypothetical protein
MMTKETVNDDSKFTNSEKNPKRSGNSRNNVVSSMIIEEVQATKGRSKSKVAVPELSNLRNSIQLFSEFSEKLTNRSLRKTDKMSKISENSKSKKIRKQKKRDLEIEQNAKIKFNQDQISRESPSTRNKCSGPSHMFKSTWNLSKNNAFIYQNNKKIASTYNFHYQGQKQITYRNSRPYFNSTQQKSPNEYRKIGTISENFNLSSSNSLYGTKMVDNSNHHDGVCVYSEFVDDDLHNIQRYLHPDKDKITKSKRFLDYLNGDERSSQTHNIHGSFPYVSPKSANLKNSKIKKISILKKKKRKNKDPLRRSTKSNYMESSTQGKFYKRSSIRNNSLMHVKKSKSASQNKRSLQQKVDNSTSQKNIKQDYNPKSDKNDLKHILTHFSSNSLVSKHRITSNETLSRFIIKLILRQFRKQSKCGDFKWK